MKYRNRIVSTLLVLTLIRLIASPLCLDVFIILPQFSLNNIPPLPAMIQYFWGCCNNANTRQHSRYTCYARPQANLVSVLFLSGSKHQHL
jgi:hypothetical protein